MTTDTIKISCPIFMISNTHLAHVYEHRKKPSTLEVYYSGTNQEQNMVPFGLGWKLCLRLRSFFYFLLFHAFCWKAGDNYHCNSTVHGTHNHFIQKKILKMSPTVLFTHLKIILLQCFQFLVFNFSKNKFNPNGTIDIYIYIYILTVMILSLSVGW